MSRERREVDALAFLGLAQRAGQVVRGIDATRRALREGTARLVLTAADASTTQLKKVRGPLERAGVPSGTLADRAALGRALGAPPVSALAVTDASFAQQLLERLGDA